MGGGILLHSVGWLRKSLLSAQGETHNHLFFSIKINSPALTFSLDLVSHILIFMYQVLILL